jgi:[acyl-carrier-protein] S-malonyltransferase
MQEAASEETSAMAAIVGAEISTIEECCGLTREKGDNFYVAIANFNGPTQTVVSGTKLGVEDLSGLLKERGVRRIIGLKVSAPFHCRLMEPARRKFEEYLKSVMFQDAKFPVVSNVSAEPVTTADHVRVLLGRQIVEPVRFTQIGHFLAGQNVRRCLEFGPGNVLSGIMKRINESMEMTNIDFVT